MKNSYEHKIIKGLSIKQRIILKGKRIVLVTPKIAKKLKNGFKKVLKGILLVAVSPIVLPVVAVVAGAKGINKGLNAVTNKMKPYIQKDLDAYTEKKFYKYGEKLYNKEEQLQELYEDETLSDELYNIYETAYLKDIENLKKKQVKVVERPKKIVVSAIFAKKLTTSAAKRTGRFFARQAKRVSGFVKGQWSRATGFVNRQWLKSKKFVLRHANAKKNEQQYNEIEQIIDETNYVPLDINGLKNKIVYLIDSKTMSDDELSDVRQDYCETSIELRIANAELSQVRTAKNEADDNIAIMYQDYCTTLEDLNDAQSELGQSQQKINRITRELEQLRTLKGELKQQVSELTQQLETEKAKEKVKQ